MRILFTRKAVDDYNSFSLSLQAKIDKQLDMLIENIRYPSLRAKKYVELVKNLRPQDIALICP